MQIPIVRGKFGSTWNGPKTKQEPKTLKPHGRCYRSLSSPASLASERSFSERKEPVTASKHDKKPLYHLTVVESSSSEFIYDLQHTKKTSTKQEDANLDVLGLCSVKFVANRTVDAICAYPVFYNTLDSYFTYISENGSEQSENFMHIEWRRVQSFASFPSTSEVRPIHLARAGFYFTGTGDQVRCYSCGITYSGWQRNDNPRDIHQRISLSCPHMNGNDPRSLPIDHNHIAASTATNERLAGTSHTRSNPTDEASASVTQTSSHTCSNLTGNTNNDQRQHFTASQNQNNDSHRRTIRTEQQCSQQTSEVSSQARSRLDPLGTNFDKPRYPSYAVLTIRISSFQNWPSHLSQNPREMAIAGFLYAGYEDYVRCFFCGGGLRNWETGDDPWVEHARWFPRCTFLRQNKGDDFISLVQEHGEQLQIPPQDESSCMSISIDHPAAKSVLEMGYSPDVVKRSLSKLKGRKEITAVQLLETILRDEEGEGSSNDPCCSTSVNDEEQPVEKATEAEQSEDAKSLIEENERLKSQRTCKICMDAESAIAMLPCGHLCCCAECAPAMRKCPICRAFVKGTVRTWLV